MYQELFKWITVIELPVFAAVFRLLLRQKKDCEQEISKCRENLNDFKIYVANNYVSNSYLKDIEARLTNHLIRIEKKLDYVGRQGNG